MDVVRGSMEIFGPDSPDAILVFTASGQVSLLTLRPRSQPGLQGSVAANSPAEGPVPSPLPGKYVLTEEASLAIPVPHLRDGLMPMRLEGICSSGVAPVSRRTAATTSARGVAVAAVHMGVLHVITLHDATAQSKVQACTSTAGQRRGDSAAGGGQDAGVLLVCVALPISQTPLYGLPPDADPLYVMQHMTHVTAMCFLAPAERDTYEPPLLAVLHKPEGMSGITPHLDSLALHLHVSGGPAGAAPSAAAGGSGGSRSSPNATAPKAVGAAEGLGGRVPASTGLGEPGGSVVSVTATLTAGPWAARILHPTTSLLAPFPGCPAADLPAGVVAISSASATLYGRPPSLADIAAAAAAASAASGGAAGSAGGGSAVGDLSGIDPLDEDAVAAAFERWFGKDWLEDTAIELAEKSVRRVVLAEYGSEYMRGLPTCAAELAPGVLVIGDSAAGLYLLHAAGLRPWFARVDSGAAAALATRGSAASVPAVMQFLPGAGSRPGPGPAGASGDTDMDSGTASGSGDGLLFLGSFSSSCQVLAVPAAHISPSAQAPVAASGPGPTSSRSAASLKWPLAEMAAIKSLAPVMDVAVVPDPSGCDDPWIVASCGTGAGGRLVRARLAAALQSYMADGPQVPDGCRLFALRLGSPGAASAPEPSPGASQLGFHTHVAFSFEAASRTDLLSVAGGSEGVFCQVEVPGLQSLAPSLLVADLAGKRLVQVLQDSVRVLKPLAAGGGLAAQWRSTEPLSLASLSGPLLAAASRTRLTLLRLDSLTGAVQQLSYMALAAQLSALALCRAPRTLATNGGQTTSSSSSSAASPSVDDSASTLVIMGQWLTNRVEAVAAAALGAGDAGGRPAGHSPASPPRLLELQLGDDETPRSLALLDSTPGGGPPVLLAGTNTGRLLMWQVALAPSHAAAWRLGPCHSLRVSQVAVELLPAQTDDPRVGCLAGSVYVHSGSGALVRLRTGPRAAPPPAAAAAAGSESWLPLEEAVEVVRVHGSDGLQALCHVSTAAMPDSACWVTREGRLLFGRVDPRVRLRWSTAFVGETIHALAYHSASHCLVALSETEPGGGHALRVIHADALQQVLAMRLAPGHYHSALVVAPLPCTSASATRSGRRPADPHATASDPHLTQHGAARPKQHTEANGAGSTSASAPSAAAEDKEFVVLASYLLKDSSADPRVAEQYGGGMQVTQGALSFLELVAAPAEGEDNATRYSLLLHGTCTTPAVASALCVARPAPYGAGGGSAAATAAAPAEKVAAGLRPDGKQTAASAAAAAAAADAATRPPADDRSYDMPYLLAGCNDGVHLYQVHVDDVAVDGERAVSRAIKLVGRLDPSLDLPLPKADPALEAFLRGPAGGGGQSAGAAGTGAGGDARGATAPGTANEGLADDESELPEVLPAAAPAGPPGDRQWEDEGEDDAVEWQFGLGATDLLAADSASSDGEDEEGPGPGQGGGRAPSERERERRQREREERRREAEAAPEAARAVRALRKLIEREDAAVTQRDLTDSGSDSDVDEGDDDPGTAGQGHRHQRPGQAGAHGSGGARGAGPGRVGPIRRLIRDLHRDWINRVTLRQLARAPTFGGASVASLSVLHSAAAAANSALFNQANGDPQQLEDREQEPGRPTPPLVVAGDLLGSVTVMQLVAVAVAAGPGGRGGGWRVSLVPTSVDRHPIFAQASLPLDRCHVLVSVHPHGLAVLRRDREAEERAVAAAQRRAVAEFEQGLLPQRQGLEVVWEAAPAGAAGAAGGMPGRAGAAGAGAAAGSATAAEPARGAGRDGPSGGGGSAAGGPGAPGRLAMEHLGLLSLRLQELPDLEMVAACRLRHMVTRMCRVPLGLQPRPHHANGPASSAFASSSVPSRQLQLGQYGGGHPAQYGAGPVLCFSASGLVAAVRLPQIDGAGSTASSVHGIAAAGSASAVAAVAQLRQLQSAVQDLDPHDTGLLTGFEAESFCHVASWPLVVPRETALGAGLAGTGTDMAGDGPDGARAAAAEVRNEGGRGAAEARGSGANRASIGEEKAEEDAEDEADALALAEDCVDGSVLQVVLEALEAVLAGEAAGGGGGGAGGTLEGVLQRLARRAVGSEDLGALAALLRRNVLVRLD